MGGVAGCYRKKYIRKKEKWERRENDRPQVIY
jgi:hypothetical protein